MTDGRMLEVLAEIFRRRGMLTGLIIDEFEDCPSSSAYASRFGSLLRAYALVGFVPDRDYRYLEVNRAIRRMHPSVVADACLGIEAAGGSVLKDETTDLLTINEEITTALVIVRCIQTSAGSLRWKVRFDTALNPDLTVVVRMDRDNQKPRDYYLFPKLKMYDAVIRLCEFNDLGFDAFRFESLDVFYAMAARSSYREAA